MMYFRLWWVGLMLVLGSSCLGPRVQTEVLVAEPAFLHAGLGGRKVAVAPMLRHPKLAYIPNAVQVHLMQKLVESGLQGKFPQTELLTAEAFQEKVGVPSLPQLRTNPEVIPLTSAQSQTLQKLGWDYLWISLLQANDEGKDTSEWKEERTETREDDQGNTTESTVTTYNTGAHACRRMVVACYVYEIATGRRVWMAVSQDERCRMDWEESSHDYLPAPAYPTAPREMELMENILHDVMKKLPR